MSPQNDPSNQNKPSTATRIRIALLALVQFALLGAAIWDLRNRPATEIHGTKWMWTPILFINFIGPIAYFTLGRKTRSY